jgi:ankyrin repeat protein
LEKSACNIFKITSNDLFLFNKYNSNFYFFHDHSLQKFELENVILNNDNFVTRENIKLDVVEFLWSQGLNVDDLRSDNNFALCRASVHGYLDIVKFLWRPGLDINDLKAKGN